jgi:hypothetical protein
MTTQRSFKRLVRMRMEKTGESYTAARRALLAADDTNVREAPGLVCSDARIRERTGRGWEEWFDVLDGWRAFELPHKDVAKKVAATLGIHPLGWAAQAITVSYERAKGLRAIGQRGDGFAASASRTISVPFERLFDAIVDETGRRSWLAGPELREVSRNGTKSIRFGVDEDGSRVTMYVAARGPAKSTLTIEHTRLANGKARDRAKKQWSAALDSLKSQLEGGESDA